MYQLTVKKRFAAAHQLKGYRGKCSHLHGHTWTVEVSVAGPELDQNGMLIDFDDLKEMLAGVVRELDHQHLNDLKAFQNCNPTAENLAKHIFLRLKGMLGPGVHLEKVLVWESWDACACYQEEK